MAILSGSRAPETPHNRGRPFDRHASHIAGSVTMKALVGIVVADGSRTGGQRRRARRSRGRPRESNPGEPGRTLLMPVVHLSRGVRDVD